MVAKSPSRFRQFRILMAIALALLAPITVIYINYVNDQRTFFTRRAFRQLGVIGHQISSRIDALKPILSSIVTSVDSYAETSGGDSPVAPSLRVKQLEDRAADVSAKGTPRFRLTEDPVVKDEPKSKAGTVNFNVTITDKDSPARILIQFDYRPDGSGSHYYLKADVTIDELAGQYLDPVGRGEGPAFDQVSIALRSSGVVLFQNGKPGLSATNLSQMEGIGGAGKQAPVDLASVSGYSGLHDVTVAGQPYKLFIEPFGSLLNSKNDPDQFLVCGLIQASQSDQASSAVPPIVLIIVLFLFLALTLSWPFIQLGLMGPDNRLRIYDVVFVAFSTVVGAGLLTIVALDLYAYLRIERLQDRQLSALSGEISASLNQDLCKAAAAMDALTSTRLISRDIDDLSRQGLQDQAEPRRHYDEKSVFQDLKVKPGPLDPLKQLAKTVRRGPFFDTVFWADPDGWQRISLTSNSYVFPLIKIKDRDYFMKVAAGDGWPLCGPDSLTFVQPVIARNSGKSLVAVAKNTGAGNPGWVTVLGARLSSIMDTAIPDGIGFCIIDHDGNALFHSDERRNLQENLFEECDESGELRSIVDSRSNAYLDTRYVGRAHRLYVRPLPSMPWSLIVFRDQSVLTAANLDLLTVSVSLLFLHCILLVALLYAVCPLHSKRRSAWIWPYHQSPGRYRALIAVNLALSLILYTAILLLDELSLLLTTWIIPTLGVLTAYIIIAEKWRTLAAKWRALATKFRQAAAKPDSNGRRKSSLETAAVPEGIDYDDDTEHRRRFRLNAKKGYALAGATMVLLLAVLPAMAGFKLAHNRQVELLVRFYQVSFVKNLNRRSHLFDERQALTSADAPSIPLSGNYYGPFFANRPPDYSVPQPPSATTLSGFDSLMAFLYRHVNRDLYFLGLQDHFSTKDSGALEAPNLEFAVTDEKAPEPSPGPQRSSRVSQQAALDSLQPASRLLQGGLQSPVPLLGSSGRPQWVAGSFLLLALMLAGLYFVVRIISRRVFLIDLKEGYGCPDQKPDCMLAFQSLAENLLVLAGPAAANLVPPEWWLPEAIKTAEPATSVAGDGAGSRVSRIPRPAGWAVVGGAECSDEAWRSQYDYDRKIAAGVTTIVIDNFDYLMEDPVANQGKVDFLRELWARRLRTIVISRINPVYFAINGRKSDEAGRSAAADASRNGSNHHSISPDEYWDDVFSSSIKVHIEPVDGLPDSLDLSSKNCQSPTVPGNGAKAPMPGHTRLQPDAMPDQTTLRPDANPPNTAFADHSIDADSLVPPAGRPAAVPAGGATAARLQPSGSLPDGTSPDQPDAQHSLNLPHSSSRLETPDSRVPSDSRLTRWLTFVPDASGDPRLLHGSVEFTDVKYKAVLDYRAIWRTLSRVERVTLFYICHDRFVSCKNASVQDLLRRGLIQRDPALCPMSKDFKKFVISAIEPEEIYSGEAGFSTWNALRAPMMAALALALIFLFYTQRSMLDSGLALAAALTVAIPAILRLVSILQRGKPATAPDSGDPQD
jgi:hypothetical protein